MAGLIRRHDWAATPVGPIEAWPQSLKVIVDLLLPCSFAMVALWGPHLIQIYNDAYRDLMGAKHPGGLGQSASECWHEITAITAPIYERVQAGETVTVQDASFPITRNGQREDAWFSLSYSPLRDESRSVAGILLTVADATRQHRAEGALHESEERLAAIFTNAAVGLSELTQDGRFLRANDEICRILGRRREDVLRLSFLDVTHPDDAAPSLSAVAEALRTGQPASLDKRYLRADGTVLWANSRVQPLHHGPGQPGTVLAVTADLTERRAAERRLRDSEGRLRALASLVPVILWRSDASGAVHAQNQSFLDYSGLTLEKVQGFGWLNCIHPDDRETTREVFHAGLANRCLIEVQHRIRRYDGQYRWFLVRQVPVPDPGGQVAEWFGAAMDIHDMHELQTRQAVLVDELQHRTRNLLTVVRSIAQQTMLRTGPTKLFREQFNDRLAALSRVQGLLSRSDQQPITIRALIQAELDALGAEATRGRIALDGPPVRLRKASVQTLALALHELATNARKYGALAGDGGELWVSWDTYRGETDEDRLSLMWLEEGIAPSGDEVGAVQSGYGRELIEKALPYALRARTSYQLSAGELRCSIDLPLDDPGKKD
ncbi:histidine kinase [Methylobacterium radiodurans]|uniref:Blue-light-activated histidine kinase n=2 Tax=Methylobacterium radiodurans TaxID=2202828 RepID=A0A2U8VYQ3_9HYPH|nr:histidine kinase [Methylobacterium radiodurans]